MRNFMGFPFDRANICLILLDESGSMRYDRHYVITGINGFKESFKNFAEANSIAVSICKFDTNFYERPFEPISDLSFDYTPEGGTALYYAIVMAAKHVKKYIQEIIEEKRIVPRVTFIVVSDGKPEMDRMSRNDAIKAISELNYSGVDTAFAALGDAMESKFGEALGFMATTDVKKEKNLIKFFGEELSKSFKNQSTRVTPLGANFFSQATNKTKSEGFSQTTQQALEDTAWIDDI